MSFLCISVGVVILYNCYLRSLGTNLTDTIGKLKIIADKTISRSLYPNEDFESSKQNCVGNGEVKTLPAIVDTSVTRRGKIDYIVLNSSKINSS